MSHLVKQKSDVKITDLETLSEACKRLGLTLNKNKKVARYYAGATTKCDAVIECPGSQYEIAVKHQSDGTYSIEADLFDPKLRNIVSTEKEKYYGEAQCDKLFQAYRVEEVVNQAVNDGYTVESAVYDPSLNEYVVEINAGY